jgi:hypothetical protein
MYCFVQILVAALAIEGPVNVPAAVQEGPGGTPPLVYSGLCSLLVIAAVLIAGYFARGAFDTPIVTIDDGPAPPRYMTQRRQYRLGMFAYIEGSLLKHMCGRASCPSRSLLCSARSRWSCC